VQETAVALKHIEMGIRSVGWICREESAIAVFLAVVDLHDKKTFAQLGIDSDP
jgi:hypothetical protein